MLKDFLSDIVAHTLPLSALNNLRIESSETETSFMSKDASNNVVLVGTTKQPIDELVGTVGFSNLEKLALHLKNPEYQETGIISVITEKTNGKEEPAYIRFENATGDFHNDYRLMNEDVLNVVLKQTQFHEPKWDVEFTPSVTSITRLKLQASAHSDETLFHIKADNNNNLIFHFGDVTTHAGSFVFESNLSKKLKNKLSFLIQIVLPILSLSGDKTIKISDNGLMMITVDSGLSIYNFVLLHQSK